VTAAAPRRAWLVIVAVVFLGLVAVDCCNATGASSWADLTRAPHFAAVHSHQPTVFEHDDGPGAVVVPPVVATVLLALVLLFVLEADRRPRWSSALATGPPRRGPPPFSVLLPRAPG
jgi:hypothetical protein